MSASTPPKKGLCGDGNNADKTLSVRRLGALLPRAPVRVLPFPFAVGVAAPLPAAPPLLALLLQYKLALSKC